jgi:hypothetical protein
MSLTEDSSRSGTIRRQAATSSSSSSSNLRDSRETVRRADVSAPTSTSSSTSSTKQNDSSSASSSGGSPDKVTIDSEQFTSLLRENFDLIVELLEDRIITDIERRGGRYRGDF